MKEELRELTPDEGLPTASMPEKSAHRIVWSLAWPAIALNSLQSVNSLLDRKFLDAIGPDALTASGAAFSVVFILFALAIALGTAATALVSRFYGANENVNLITATRQSVTLGLLFGIVFGALAYWAAPLLASLFLDRTAHPKAFEYSILYLRPVAAAMPALFTFNALASCMRAVGDTRTPMYVSGIQIFLHIVLNMFLMFPTRDVHILGKTYLMHGLDMGVMGSGLAFCVSAWFAMFAYFLVSNRTALGQTWRLQYVRIEWAVRILRIAWPAAVQNLIRALSMVMFMMALKLTAESAAATGAMAMSISLESMAFMPVFGYMIAASALVGQSLGMKRPDRAERLAWCAAHQGVLVMVVMGAVLFFFARPLAHFFVTDPEQQFLAMRYLQIMAISEPMFGYAVVLAGAHQGAGDTMRPTIVAVITNIGCRLGIAWIFAVWMQLGTIAAWWALSLSTIMQGALMIVFFRQGHWKTKQV